MKKAVLMMALAAFMLGGAVNAQETKPAQAKPVHKEAHHHHHHHSDAKMSGKNEVKK